jgi:hypothetical protein
MSHLHLQCVRVPLQCKSDRLGSLHGYATTRVKFGSHWTKEFL